jgi:hypothetical protein
VDNEKLEIYFATASLFVVIGHSALAQKSVTCVGILIEVDMNPRADFAMAVVYDDTDVLDPRTCVLDLGHAGHWPPRGACSAGEKCLRDGPYYKKIGNTYYMREWNRAEAPDNGKPVSTATDAADGPDMTCRGILKEVENTGGDNVQIGPCHDDVVGKGISEAESDRAAHPRSGL